MKTPPLLKGNTMLLTDIENPFGTDAYSPAAAQTPSRTLYYKGMRLPKAPVQLPRAPRSLSQILRDFALNYNG